MANMDKTTDLTTDLPDELLESILKPLLGYSGDLASFVQCSGENKSVHNIEARALCL